MNTKTQLPLFDQYREVADKVVELYPNGQQIIDGFVARNADVDPEDFFGHGPAQALVRDLVTMPELRDVEAFKALMDWGFLQRDAHLAPEIECDFIPCCTTDALTESGWTRDDLGEEFIERHYGLDHYLWRVAIVEQRQEILARLAARA